MSAGSTTPEIVIRDETGNRAIVSVSGGLSTVANPWKTIIHNNATLVASGSQIITGLGYSEWYLIINLKNAPTGTLPKIQFKIEELDPVDLATVIELKATGVLHSIAEIESLNIREIDSDTVKISWTITGAGASWSGVNVAWLGHVSGNAIEGLADVGTLAEDAPVPIALVDANGLVQRIRGDSLGDIGVAANLVTGYAPDPMTHVDVPQPLVSDPSQNLITRGTVLTDEGSFRDDFSGSSLLTVLTGTLTFTNGATAVTGVGTAFTTELGTNHYIRLSSGPNSALTRIVEVIDDVTLELDVPYPGSSGSGAGTASFWEIFVPAAPASILVGSSLVAVKANLVNGAIVGLERDGDYLPFLMNVTLAITQRITNQQAVVGFQNIAFTPLEQAVYVFDGTDATKVTCRSSYAADSTESTTVSIPNSGVTSAQHVYKIDQQVDRVVFSIDGTQVAAHRTHLPKPYTPMEQLFYIENTGVPASSTTLNVDAILFYDHDNLDVAEPLAVEGVAGGQPITVQFGNPGGVLALPKLINVNYNKSDGAIVANAWKRVATYTVPVGYNGYLIKFISFQGEAALSRIVAETNLGTHNDNTNVFTAGAAYSFPAWAGVTQAEVTTAFAAGSGNVVLTVTYTNELSVAARTGTITVPKGSAIGARFDLVLQTGDLGVVSIQAISGTPAQVGIVKVLGFVQLALHEDQSTTTQTETLYAPGAITFPTGTVLGLEYAGGTVSKSRLVDALVQLVQ